MSAATQPRRRAHVSPRHAIRHTGVIVRRNLLRIVRLPQLLLFATVQPVMFLILFNYVFGGAVGRVDSRGSRGSVPQLAGAGPAAAGRRVRLHPDLDGADRRPQQRRNRPLPLAADGALRGARPGRTVADLIRNGFVIGLMLVLGYALGFRPQTSLVPLAGALLVALAFAFALSWVMAAIGLTVKNSEAAQSAVFIPIFPLVFASSIFVPTATLPDWLRVFRRPSAGNPHRQRGARPDPRRGARSPPRRRSRARSPPPCCGRSPSSCWPCRWPCEATAAPVS